MNKKLASAVKQAMDKKADSNEIKIPNTGAILQPRIGFLRGVSVSISGVSTSEGKIVFRTEKEDFTDEELDRLPIEIANEIRPYAEEFGRKIEEILESKGFKK